MAMCRFLILDEYKAQQKRKKTVMRTVLCDFNIYESFCVICFTKLYKKKITSRIRVY